MIDTLSSMDTDNYLLKFVPSGEDKEFHFKITFTLEDLLNPYNRAQRPTREIAFEFKARSLKENTLDVCFSSNNSCQSGGASVLNFDQNGVSMTNYLLEAAKGEEDTISIEVYNNNTFQLTPFSF